MPARIEDYALIGDCQAAALVSRDGSIDWLCLPRFDSAACFAALLGSPDNGRWRIAPSVPVASVRRRYRDGTLILETEFHTADGGVAALIDFMPPRTARPDLVRIVEGRRGSVPMRMDLSIRFDYGSIIPWVRQIPGGIRATAGPETLYLAAGTDMHGEDFHTVSEFTIAPGERIAYDLAWSPTHEAQPAAIEAHDSLASAEAWWRNWSDRCTYQGPWREAVERSLITLKALTYAPTGGIVAAPTTSLPERIGGVRNWDYRFCWLRDSTFTLYALMNNGYTEEALAWREWLVHAVAGMPSRLQIMYGIAGERRLTELELDWLPGYEGSAPVRVGNDAYRQHQLDVYGEVMDTLHHARRMGLPSSDDAWRVQRAMMQFLETDWREPDEGIWEFRNGRRQYTHSKVMAWVAADRAVKAVEEFGSPGDLARWLRLRDDIHRQVCDQGFNARINSFVQYYGAEHPDASLLMLPLVGFLPATDPRMRGTIERIQRELVRGGFAQRYPSRPDVDHLPPGEGAFLLCTFWLADNLALLGRHDEAREVFDRLLGLRNDVGLLSEEYDPGQKRLVGNFPQAFSHLALINTARNLTRQASPAEQRSQ